MSKKFKFDVVIGNPPYQEETQGDSSSSTPIYHHFMEEAYKVASRVSFITPARFLFNAGQTPKPWNKKMLNDEHLKVEFFEQDSSKVFSNTDIKGGVAVTYRDVNENYGAIGIFIAIPELDKIFKKVQKSKVIYSISEIIYARTSYKLTKVLHTEHPNAKALLSNGHDFDVATNIFDSLDFIFLDNKPADGEDYIQILGKQNNERVYKWIKSKYIANHPNLNKWKVFLPKSNGSGAIGEVLSTPLIGEPLIGANETFMSFGAFDTEIEAYAVLKYLKSKFARTMLGVLKITQDNPIETWKYVPLQDFTSNSDIDWSKSISEIDQQLYRKYGLDKDEINFIESHVKEME
jgi:hypothetical protein